MTITVASFQTACAECADAINSELWSTAHKKCAVAEAINAGLELEAAADDRSFKRRESLAGLRAAIEAAKAQTVRAGESSRFVTTRMGFNL